MSRSPPSSPQRSRGQQKGPTAEEKLKDITDKIAQLRLQRRQLSPDGKEKDKEKRKSKRGAPGSVPKAPKTASPGSPGSRFDDRVVREFFHPQLDYVIAEVAYSPYMTSPIETYPSHTLHLSAKIRNLKALGKKSSELSEEERPCNFSEAKKIFARIVNYKATFEGNSIDSNDRPETMPPLRPKTPKKGKSGLLKASCARGGPAKYAKKIRQIKEERRKEGKPDEPYLITLDPIEPPEREGAEEPQPDRGSPAPPQKPGTRADPYRSPGKPAAEKASEPLPAVARADSGNPPQKPPSEQPAEPLPAVARADSGNPPQKPPSEQPAEPMPAVARADSADSAGYGDDFEATGSAPHTAHNANSSNQSKAGESDGIYDDDDEDFESYTSKQIRQHAEADTEGRSSARAGASATVPGGSRPESKSLSMAPAVPSSSSKCKSQHGNGDVSDLEDSIC